MNNKNDISRSSTDEKILLAPFQLMSAVVFVLTVSPQQSNYKCAAVDSGVRLEVGAREGGKGRRK